MALGEQPSKSLSLQRKVTSGLKDDPMGLESRRRACANATRITAIVAPSSRAEMEFHITEKQAIFRSGFRDGDFYMQSQSENLNEMLPCFNSGLNTEVPKESPSKGAPFLIRKKRSEMLAKGTIGNFCYLSRQLGSPAAQQFTEAKTQSTEC